MFSAAGIDLRKADSHAYDQKVYSVLCFSQQVLNNYNMGSLLSKSEKKKNKPKPK